MCWSEHMEAYEMPFYNTPAEYIPASIQSPGAGHLYRRVVMRQRARATEHPSVKMEKRSFRRAR